MISTKTIFLFCPIPEDQKPINEYIDLKENPFFHWILRSKKSYFSKLFFYGLFLSSLLFLFEFFVVQKTILQSIFASFFFVSFFFSFLFFFLSFRWKEIYKKFTDAKIFYEEASWFDGQIWEKPFFLLKNDKLIATQKIQPILRRLFFSLFFFNFFLFFFASFEFQ
jgi:hypothetical protein